MAIPVKPSDVAATIPDSTASICDKLNALFSITNKMSEAWAYMFNEDGTVTSEFLGMFFPSGSMVLWPKSSNIPSGFVVANGQILSSAAYPVLAGIYGATFGGDGTNTFGVPNMADRFPIGASGTKAAGTTGGASSVTLVEGNIPEMNIDLKSPATKLEAVVTSGGTNSEGGGTALGRLDPEDLFEPLGNTTPDPVNILNPYFAGTWIIKT